MSRNASRPSSRPSRTPDDARRFTVSADHRFEQARWLPSPNRAARPTWAEPELIVLHCISLPEGVYGTEAPHRLFQGLLDVREHESFHDLEGLEVSAHLLVERDGALAQFVPFDEQAYHAGLSVWTGRAGCNPFSIGIELEGVADQPFESVQYETLLACLRSLLATYPGLSVGNIVGHADIAPGRKVDPGSGFRWDRVLQRLHQDMFLYLTEDSTA